MPSRSIPHAWRLLAGLASAALAQAALADGTPRVPLLPKYQQECAACHVAFPPGLLPLASWQTLMANLPRHYGTDASLDAASARELSTWLAAHAGSSRRVRDAPPDDRITRSAWFTREHDEVPAATWKLPAVKSASNCAACHTQAAQGDFSERSVHLPR
jgi:Dihaem cytochrome c